MNDPIVWSAFWNFQGQAWAGWELSILSWMVLLRPLRLLQRLDEPLSILLHKHTLCTKTDRGSSSLCSSLRGLNSTIQLRIDSYQPAQACPWKFHNPVYANGYVFPCHKKFQNYGKYNYMIAFILEFSHKMEKFKVSELKLAFWFQMAMKIFDLSTSYSIINYMAKTSRDCILTPIRTN